MSKSINSLRVLCVVLVATICISPWTAAARNVAIVIGNSEYSYLARLPNASRDAYALGNSLTELGFEVFSGTNLSLQQTKRLLIQATASEEPIDTVVFFFAGHGVQMGGSNFLLASNADGTDKRSLRKGAIDASDIVQEMSLHSQSVVVILDACRDNPFTSGTFGYTASSSASGLADLLLPPGSFVAYSTQPGHVALDGGGRNSPFTEAILRHIRTPGATIQDVMLRVRKDVSDTTNGAQIPFERSALLRPVIFSPSELARDKPLVSQTASKTSPQIEHRVTHWVEGLNPYGDGFLSLRVAPSAGTSELRKLIEGTKLSLIATRGRWMQVRLLDGQEGWVHSDWVVSAEDRVQPPAQSAKVADMAIEALNCADLWFQRNKIFHNHGYCFSTTRGRKAFSNAACDPEMKAGEVHLTAAETSLVSQIKAREKEIGC